MSIMNAEVIAENRPDSSTYQPYWLSEREESHKNESGVQIFIVLFLKVVIVLGDFLLEPVVETSPGIGATVLSYYRLQGVA